MRSILFRTGFLLASFFMAEHLRAQSSRFQIEFFQDDRFVSLRNDTLMLEKKPFQMRFTLENLEGIYLNVNENSEYFDLRPGEAIRDFEYLDLKVVAEVPYNRDRDLIPGPDLFHYLYFHPEDDYHRFDPELSYHDHVLVASRTVEKIWYSDPERSIPIQEFGKPLYLFFLTTAPGNRGKEEIARARYVLLWK